MKNLLILSLLLLAGMISAKNESGLSTTDLELAITSANTTPSIYTTTTADVTITNTGSETANNIRINLFIPEGFVLTGGDEYDATAGIYSGVSNNWRIENLAPGTTETLTLNIFTLTENTVSLYGQVSEADGNDTDSTPGNGIPYSPNEDDEAIFYFNGTPLPGLPDLAIGNVNLVSGISSAVQQGNGIGFQVELVNQGDPINPDDFPYNNGIYLSEDNIFSGDDLLLEETRISGLGILAMGGIIPADFPLGERYIFFATDIDNDITELNGTNNVSAPFPIMVIPMSTGDGIDLELSLIQSLDNPDRFSSYFVQLTLENTGNETATNIEVNVPRPDGVVYTGGNEFTLSAGDFNEFSDVLTVSELASGGNVVLTLNYFLLTTESPVVYAQVTQATGNDADSTPNNGTPPAVNEDDEASTDMDAPPTNLPDLLIAEVDMPTTIFKGVPTSFTYLVQNLGAASAEGPFDVSYYFSTDDQLDADDILFGSDNFENLSVGAFMDNQHTFTFLQFVSSIPTGPGYIIIKADSDDLILESNEGNNIVATAVNIAILGEPECATNLRNGTLNCIQDTPDGGKEIYFTITDETSGTVNGFLTTVDMNGRLTSSQNLGELPPEVIYRRANSEDQSNLLQKLENGTVVEELTIPTSITNNYDFIAGATAFNDGFVLFGVLDTDLTAILTDENLNPIAENVLPSVVAFISSPNVIKAIQISSDQVAVVSMENAGLPGKAVGLTVINSNLEVLSSELLVTGQFVTGGLEQNTCGDFVLRTNTYTLSNYTFSGPRTTNSVSYGRFVNGEFIKESSSFSSYSYTLQTVDGGEVLASKSSGSNEVFIEKTLNGNVVFSKTVELNEFIIQLVEISGSIYLLTSQGLELPRRLYDVECLEDTTTPTDGVDLELNSKLSINAPEIYSQYSVVYTLANTGVETATDIAVDFELPAGTVYEGGNEFLISRGTMNPYTNVYNLDELPVGEIAVIQLNYFLKSSSSQVHYAQVSACNEDDVDSTPGNGVPPTANEDDETAISTAAAATLNEDVANHQIEEDSKRLEILKLYPNPTMEQEVNLVFGSPKETVRTLLVYNAQGTEMIRKTISLNAGYNHIQLAVQDLPSGIYRILIPGEHARFVTSSFTVIK